MYAMGILCLYILVEDDQLFYTLRDNTYCGSQMSKVVNEIPQLKLIGKMMETDPNDRIGLVDCKNAWDDCMETYPQRITRNLLLEHGLLARDLKPTFPDPKHGDAYWQVRNKRFV